MSTVYYELEFCIEFGQFLRFLFLTSSRDSGELLDPKGESNMILQNVNYMPVPEDLNLEDLNCSVAYVSNEVATKIVSLRCKLKAICLCLKQSTLLI